MWTSMEDVFVCILMYNLNHFNTTFFAALLCLFSFSISWLAGCLLNYWYIIRPAQPSFDFWILHYNAQQCMAWIQSNPATRTSR